VSLRTIERTEYSRPLPLPLCWKERRAYNDRNRRPVSLFFTGSADTGRPRLNEAPLSP
jgi:hypothetical protein